MLVSTGTMKSVIGVAKSTPQASEIAAGIKYCACSEVSKRSGISPQTVVIVVRMIARKRPLPDIINAF